jgi:hypothetical protein
MAHSTLPVFSHPHFPQVFNRTIDQAVRRLLARPQLGVCCYESPETLPGACDGQPCYRAAIVHDLATDQEFCARHFAAVEGEAL